MANQTPPDDTDSANKSPQQMDEFVRLFAAHQRTVFLYLNSLLPARRDVDDLFQETSLVCWREFDKFTPGTNFAAWACTIAFNRVRAWRKKQSREALVFSEEFLRSVADELTEQADVYSDRADALQSCVEKLPQHHRELLAQRYTAERSIESLADRLGRTSDAIYRMLSRIRHALHECVNFTIKTQGST